jgi:hypothetical protein
MPCPACLQDRFHDFVPALSKWAGTIVGLTLIAIGLLGLYETYFESSEEHGHEGEMNLAMAGEQQAVLAASAGF